MNFLDTYDITGTSTPPPNRPEQSLNEEVSQVIGQLGRYWGGFRKQSLTALDTARKDISGVVTQAQKELSKLTNEAPKESSPDGKSASELDNEAQAGPSSKSENTSSPSTPTDRGPPPSSIGTQTLFSRLQSALPPNIVATVQNNLPETLKHASENIDLAQLRMTLSSEFQRVQGVTRAQAEEYVHKSESLLREAVKEAGEVLRDAVKVIPPEEVGSSNVGTSGLVWDGADMWMLPFDPSDTSLGPTGSGKGKDPSPSSGRPSGETQGTVATRAEALMKRLKHDPEIIRHDPEGDQGVRELYTDWLRTEVDIKDGGIEGSEWKARIAAMLNEVGDGAGLQATQDELVPAEMNAETFWKRFFFRVYQIEKEEAKRKALLQGPVESEEDFSWEDDDDEVTSPTSSSKTTTVPPQPQTVGPQPSTKPIHPPAYEQLPIPLQQPAEPATNPGNLSAPSSQTHTPANTSPRESEDSYDLVSSGNVSASGEGKVSDERSGDADDADSDWE